MSNGPCKVILLGTDGEVTYRLVLGFVSFFPKRVELCYFPSSLTSCVGRNRFLEIQNFFWKLLKCPLLFVSFVLTAFYEK